jgi:UDP-N-acetylmuramyl tripeptide synthase
VYYGHVGCWRCPGCGRGRPRPQIVATAIARTADGGTRLRIAEGGRTIDIAVAVAGLYNAYNALAALAVARSRGIAVADAAAALGHVTAPFGRVEDVDVQGRNLRLLLVKNPAGFNQIIQTFLQSDDTNPTRLMLVINDGFADGRDLSWLWDAAIEDVGRCQFVLCSGVRAADMALRFKYAGLAAEVVPDVDEAIAELLRRTPVGENARVLANYTAMLELRTKLDHVADVKAFWA